MRITRLQRFRKYRREKAGKLFLFALILPSSSILIGYLITMLFILPSMGK